MAIAAHIYGFYQHSNRVGTALIHTEEHTAAVDRASGTCSSFPASEAGGDTDLSAAAPGAALASDTPDGATAGGNPTVYALLKAPSIGLVAPVVEGVGDAQLNVAVGHVPASSWPGNSGTSVLAGHDVTWFSRIDQLAPGEQLSVVSPCQTFVYTVEEQQVISANTPIYQSTSGRLVLITCYPTNALFLTSQRYVVSADLSRVVETRGKAATPYSAAAPVVPAPPALAAQGLDLAHNSAPMGSLSVTGSPSVGWQESAGPLDDTAAVLALYFAAVRSAEQNQADWWAAIAPGVPFGSAAPLVGATVVDNDVTVSPSLEVNGTALTGVTLVTEPVLSGSGSTGTYRVEMTGVVEHGQLVLSGWSMQPVGG